MKIKVVSSSPEVSIVGIGRVETNKAVEITAEQAERFERVSGKTLAEAGLLVKETRKKKEDS